MKLELIAAVTFGLEAVTKREIENLGYEILCVEDGKITFLSDERGIIRSNLWLRTCDRIGIKLGEFTALESEDLFQMVKGIPWGKWLPMDANFVINASVHKSNLKSERVTQSVCEKAIIDRLKETYVVDRFPKTGAKYDIKVTILKDRATVTLDTTGPSLHKRGYRKLISDAPIKETLAASMVLLSYYRDDKILVDPCCGSGTIPIEACMISLNIAPGILRRFAFNDWNLISEEIFQDELKLAKDSRVHKELKIYGSDIDPNMIKIAKENAKALGVEQYIKFNVCDISKIKTKAEYGVMITNPPYGIRIGDKDQIEHIYDFYKEFFEIHKTWSLFVITPDKEIENEVMRRKADRRRKLYNGRLEVCYYQFHGEKPIK